MALKKAKELPSGVQGEYWKIISATVDRDNLKLTVAVALFKDKATSDAGKKHLGVIHRFTGSVTEQQSLSSLVEIGYAMIKAQCAVNPLPMINRIALNDLKDAVDA